LGSGGLGVSLYGEECQDEDQDLLDSGTGILHYACGSIHMMG